MAQSQIRSLLVKEKKNSLLMTDTGETEEQSLGTVNRTQYTDKSGTQTWRTGDRTTKQKLSIPSLEKRIATVPIYGGKDLSNT